MTVANYGEHFLWVARRRPSGTLRLLFIVSLFASLIWHRQRTHSYCVVPFAFGDKLLAQVGPNADRNGQTNQFRPRHILCYRMVTQRNTEPVLVPHRELFAKTWRRHQKETLTAAVLSPQLRAHKTAVAIQIKQCGWKLHHYLSGAARAIHGARAASTEMTITKEVATLGAYPRMASAQAM